MSQKTFAVGDYVVYPAHGVGQIVAFENQQIADFTVELMAISFNKDRKDQMLLRVPVAKAKASGLRPLSTQEEMKKAIDLLKVKTRARRVMWSRRAQEYEAKINSGEIVLIAEVTRDLFRPDDQPEQSYSERQIFEAASSRLARELAAMEKTDEPTALEKILDVLREHAPQYYENNEDA